jgi:hypothetical protein
MGAAQNELSPPASQLQLSNHYGNAYPASAHFDKALQIGEEQTEDKLSPPVLQLQFSIFCLAVRRKLWHQPLKAEGQLGAVY